MIFINSLWHYIQLSSPYLMLGFLLSGMIKAFMPNEKISQWLGPQSRFSLLKATLIGVPLPLCSCSVIPTAVTLRRAGASKGATSAFLISTPESGIDSMFMTYAMIDLPMTLFRPLAAFLSGLTAGMLQILFNPEEKNLSNEPLECCKVSQPPKVQSQISTPPNLHLFARLQKGLSFAFGDLINDMSLWLAFGLLLGAFIDFIVPPHFFEQISPTNARLIILLVGIPLYICASAATPIAASLMVKGMSPGVALLLLLVGPATNLSNIVILQKYLGKKGVFLNIVAVMSIALLLSYICDWAYSTFQWSLIPNLEHSSHHHETQSGWWPILNILCSLVLSFFIIRGILLELKKKWKR